LPASERPRERLAALGAGALSQQELLACLLGRGFAGESVITTAQRLLGRFGDLSGIAQAPLEELAAIRGMGLAKASALKAACELSRRVEVSPAPATASIGTPEAALRLARRHLAGRRKEHFVTLLLDSRHRVIRVAEVSVGSLEASIVHPRETFLEAITAGAAAVILAHNHPSGDPTPSPEDLKLTRRLIEAGKLLGIPVLDHLIIGREGGLSLKANGFLEF
jgi:DNA repair protein RadC